MKAPIPTYVRSAALAAALLLSGCLSESETSLVSPSPGDTSNRAPIISGNPANAVMIGNTYNFTPTASDPDGDTLTFSIGNRPSWATFDSATGRLFGTPTLADVGQYANVQISVSDGAATASLSAFAVDVTQVATASTTLSWTAPTRNDDGSMLSDLAGYKIYYGRSSGNYSNEIRITNPSITTYVVDNLSADTYFFSATAFNAAGTESRFSTEIVKAVN